MRKKPGKPPDFPTMNQKETALAVIEQQGLSQFQKATADELDSSLHDVNKEMFELQEKIKELKKERQVLEMLFYVMYPEEAMESTGRGDYHGAAHMVAIRLSQIRGDRGANKIRAQCSIAGCMLDVLAKGLCKFHYDEETRGKRIAPVKEGEVIQETAKKGQPKFVRKELDVEKIADAMTEQEKQNDFQCPYCNKACLSQEMYAAHTEACRKLPRWNSKFVKPKPEETEILAAIHAENTDDEQA